MALLLNDARAVSLLFPPFAMVLSDVIIRAIAFCRGRLGSSGIVVFRAPGSYNVAISKYVKK